MQLKKRKNCFYIAAIAALLLCTTVADAQNQRTRVRGNNAVSGRTGARGPRAASSPSFNEVLTTRRSIRNYDATKKISEAEVRTLIKAAQEAPSWANQQPTKYYVAISQEKLTAVQNLVGGNKERIKNAPVLIISTYERGKSGFFQGNPANEVGDGWGAYDNGLSNCYLVLQARAMGFDTLIMGMREADKLRELFSIPQNETVMAVIAFGYRAEEPTQPRHKELDDIVKFY